MPMLIMHGSQDSIVAVGTSRRSAMALQAVGAQHIYLEFPGKDHEFWIRRGAETWKVFLFLPYRYSSERRSAPSRPT